MFDIPCDPMGYEQQGEPGRFASADRKTRETQIEVFLDVDRCCTDDSSISTGIPFLNHMLEQFSRHSGFGLNVKAEGDLDVDNHHTVEDVGIVVGQCLHKALGSKMGIRRYGHSYVPLDEALSRVVVDFSGRPGLWYQVDLVNSTIGSFDADLVHEFFQGFVNHAQATIHVDSIRGRNSHHIVESIFKAFAKACSMAVESDSRMASRIPSTKGVL